MEPGRVAHMSGPWPVDPCPEPGCGLHRGHTPNRSPTGERMGGHIPAEATTHWKTVAYPKDPEKQST